MTKMVAKKVIDVRMMTVYKRILTLGNGDDYDNGGDHTSAEHISLFIRSFALSEVSTSVGKSKQF